MRDLGIGLRTLVLPYGAPAGAPAIIIGPDIPAELVTFYAVESATVVGVIINRKDSTHYVYDALLVDSGGFAVRAIGGYNGVVTESYRIFEDARALYGQRGTAGVAFTGTGTALLVRSGALLRIGGPDAAPPNLFGTLEIQTGAGFTIDGLSAPRGLIFHKGDASATLATVSSTVDVAILTQTNVTIHDGRAYKLIMKAFHTSTAAQDIRYRVRTVNVSGTIIGDFGDKPLVATASGGEGVADEAMIKNVSGADVTHDFVWCFSLRTGVTSASVVSRNSSPSYFELWDVGPAGQFSDAKAVT